MSQERLERMYPKVAAFNVKTKLHIIEWPSSRQNDSTIIGSHLHHLQKDTRESRKSVLRPSQVKPGKVQTHHVFEVYKPFTV